MAIKNAFIDKMESEVTDLDILKTTLLYDFYGELLTDKQKEIYELFYQNDMSLSEIAGELEISRQAVRDQLKRTEKILSDYEDKLRLVEKFMANKASANRIRELIDELEEKNELSAESMNIAEQIRMAVDEITE
ncbi:MAG: YlxM family DNA-binding protein [Clostridiales bacterium]|nr:YlxM family DNA-binding protein [Clostridiales bacterium]